MFTRKDYMSGKCTHDQYYGQMIIESSAVSVVSSLFTLDELRKAYAENKDFNTIPLQIWDNAAKLLSTNFRKYEDIPTLAGDVCILKRAAKFLVDE